MDLNWLQSSDFKLTIGALVERWIDKMAVNVWPLNGQEVLVVDEHGGRALGLTSFFEEQNKTSCNDHPVEWGYFSII